VPRAKKKENHADRAHAVLSASGASRWLNCTPSARLSEGLIEETSEAALEGTLAHELSENILRLKLDIINAWTFSNKNLEIWSSPLYYSDMEDEVEPYVTLVMEQVAEARSVNPDALILIEQKVSLEAYIEKGFGTCDFLAIADGILYVTDLKFGKGVRVSAIENSQLKLYGVGALESFGLLYDIHTVRLTIAQPRLDAVSTWDIPAEDLMLWAEQYVIPKAKLAFEGKGECNIGDWCRFCKAKSLCPAFHEQALLIAEVDFAAPVGLVEEQELLEVYLVADRITNYLEAVKKHVFTSALAGKKWEGFKLVLSSKNRKISDEAKAMEIFEEAGYDLYDYANLKIKGLGDLKKNIGERKRDELLGKLLIKPEGEPTLVSAEDKRQEINKVDDFLN
jgi:hypothetical protein